MGFGVPGSAVVVVMDSGSETPVGLMVEPALAATFEFDSVERFSVDWVSVSSVIVECAAVFEAGVDTTSGSVGVVVVDCAAAFEAGVDTVSGSVGVVVVDCAAAFEAGVDTVSGSVGVVVVDCAAVFEAGVDTMSGSVGMVVVGPTGSVGFEGTEGVTVGFEGTIELVEDSVVLTGSVVVCDRAEEGVITATVVFDATVGVVSGVVVVRVVDPP